MIPFRMITATAITIPCAVRGCTHMVTFGQKCALCAHCEAIQFRLADRRARRHANKTMIRRAVNAQAGIALSFVAVAITAAGSDPIALALLLVPFALFYAIAHVVECYYRRENTIAGGL